MAERGRPRAFDRDRALTRAMEVFWEKGYAGASLADLKAAMGINAPSLYAAFGSKQQLFEAAVDRYAECEGRPLWTRFHAAPDARSAIAALLADSADAYVAPDRPKGCLVVLGALIGGEAEKEVAADLLARRRQALELLEKRLARDVAEGRLPRGADCRRIATFYVTVQQGMSLQARDGADRAMLQAVATSAMAAWDGLISA